MFFTKEELKELDKMIADGFIYKNKHPDYPIYIYNYSKKTQYDWIWNKYTIQCRGLILDADGNLIAKGLDKFFTHDQLLDMNMKESIPNNEPFEITEKMDGSLGIMYFWNGMNYISTRGLFESEMALEATSMLREEYKHIAFFEQYSYIFEIIYPENKIIVDYGEDRKLVLLAVINNETLQEENIYDEKFDYIEAEGLERVIKYDGISDWGNILDKFDNNNKEGFVVKFLKSNFRVKMKFDWYKNLAHIYQNFNKKSIWKKMRDEIDIEELIKDVDDEFYPIVKNYMDELNKEYDSVHIQAVADCDKHIDFMINKYNGNFTKKEFALELFDRVDKKTAQFVLAVYNNKQMNKMIINEIEPKN